MRKGTIGCLLGGAAASVIGAGALLYDALFGPEEPLPPLEGESIESNIRTDPVLRDYPGLSGSGFSDSAVYEERQKKVSPVTTVKAPPSGPDPEREREIAEFKARMEKLHRECDNEETWLKSYGLPRNYMNMAGNAETEDEFSEKTDSDGTCRNIRESIEGLKEKVASSEYDGKSGSYEKIIQRGEGLEVVEKSELFSLKGGFDSIVEKAEKSHNGKWKEGYAFRKGFKWVFETEMANYHSNSQSRGNLRRLPLGLVESAKKNYVNIQDLRGAIEEIRSEIGSGIWNYLDSEIEEMNSNRKLGNDALADTEKTDLLYFLGELTEYGYIDPALQSSLTSSLNSRAIPEKPKTSEEAAPGEGKAGGMPELK